MTTQAARIIDGDGHIIELDEDILPYLDSKYHFEGIRSFPFYPTLDGWMRTALVAQRGGPRPGSNLHPDSSAWLKFLDEHGISETVIYPTGGLGFGLLKDPVWAADLAHAYNGFLYDRFLKVSPRLKAVALIPVQNPAAAAKELNHAVNDLGFVGGFLPATGLRLPYGDSSFYPIFEEAQRLNTMLAVHGGPQQGLGFDSFQSFLPGMALEHPISQMIQFTSMISERIFEKFPRLKVAFLEAGCGWAPYLVERLDRIMGKGVGKGAASDQVRNHPVYFHAELDEEAIPHAISAIGDDHFIYASDWPHESDEEIAEVLAFFQAREDLSPGSKRKILFDNIEALYAMNG